MSYLSLSLWLISFSIMALRSIFSSVQSLSRVRLFATPWTTARQASLSIINSWSSPKPMSIESVMPSNHLILCCPLLLLPSTFPSIRVFLMSQLFASGGQSIGGPSMLSKMIRFLSFLWAKVSFFVMGKGFFLSHGQIWHCKHIPHLYPFAHSWMLMLFPYLGNYEWTGEHIYLSDILLSNIFGYISRSGIPRSYGSSISKFFLFFWLHHVVYGILVPWPGIEFRSTQ